MLTRLMRPLSWLYGGLTDIRNRLYNSQIKRVYKPPVPTVCVGNITVGGTGKTPMVDYILEHIKSIGPVATLSRGYGRKTSGFRVANPSDTAETLGDEPLLLYRKHRAGVTVSVGEKRAEAIPRLLAAYPELKAIVLDDAFQHRPVEAHLNVLLTDYNRLFVDDHPFPAGRLRERRHGAQRADVVVVTKCPDNIISSQQEVAARLRPYLRPETPVFFTRIRYSQPVAFRDKPENTPANTPFSLLTGIASAQPLVDYLKKAYPHTFRQHLNLPDHHHYTEEDLARPELSTAGQVVLTTEKDFVKLAPLLEKTGLDAGTFFYLPIEVDFVDHETEFVQLLTNLFVNNS